MNNKPNEKNEMFEMGYQAGADAAQELLEMLNAGLLSPSQEKKLKNLMKEATQSNGFSMSHMGELMGLLHEVGLLPMEQSEVYELEMVDGELVGYKYENEKKIQVKIDDL